MRCNSKCHYYADFGERGLFCALYELELTKEDFEDNCSRYISEKDYQDNLNLS